MKITPAVLKASAVQLAGSEKGRDTLQRLLAWLDDSGLSLDEKNQRAVLLLVRGAWTSHAETARNAMRDELRGR